MAESTLSITLTDLRNRVGYLLGYGRNYAAYSADQQADVDASIEDGYRWFLYPAQVPGAPIPYAWRFLKVPATLVLWAPVEELAGRTVVAAGPIIGGATPMNTSVPVVLREMVGSTISINGVGDFEIASYFNESYFFVVGNAMFAANDLFAIAATGRVRLPDDCATILDDELTYQSSGLGRTVRLIDEPQIELMRQRDENSPGTPVAACMRHVRSDQAAGQASELLVYPNPSSDVTVNYTYQVRTDKLTTANPFPLGGMEHGDTVLAGCLAAAEYHILDDRKGPRWEEFVTRLNVSVANDRRDAPPRRRYNGDGSDGRGRWGRGYCRDAAVASYGNFPHPYL